MKTILIYLHISCAMLILACNTKNDTTTKYYEITSLNNLKIIVPDFLEAPSFPEYIKLDSVSAIGVSKANVLQHNCIYHGINIHISVDKFIYPKYKNNFLELIQRLSKDYEMIWKSSSIKKTSNPDKLQEIIYINMLNNIKNDITVNRLILVRQINDNDGVLIIYHFEGKQVDMSNNKRLINDINLRLETERHIAR